MSTISAIKQPSTATSADQQIEQIYQAGLKAHQNNDFKNARELYLNVLAKHPTHVKSLYLLGVLCCQTQQFTEAINYLDKAILLSPEHAEAHSSRGNALNQLQQFEEALKCYVKATSINPEYAEAYHNQGITLVNLKRYSEAIASFDEAIRLDPNHAMAYFEKANIALTLNDYKHAIANFERCLAIAPAFSEASTHLKYAQDAFALSKNTNNADAITSDLGTQTLHSLLAHGEKLEHLNLNKLARAHYEEAVQRFPTAAKAHIKLGMMCKLENQAKEALACFDTAIALNENSALAYQKRGELFTRINRADDAILDYEKALSIDGNLYQYYFAVAFAYRSLGRLDDALEYYRLWGRLGAGKRNKQDQAIADFSESMIWLLKGHYQLGWQLYEGRWIAVSSKHFRNFKQPLWLGEDISDKHILLHAEQGYGDTLQMFRYVEFVASRAARVTLEVNGPIQRLLKNNTSVEVINKENALPDFDVQCPLMSLPLAFKTTIETIPAIKKSFKADKETEVIWAQKVQQKTGVSPQKRNIGFVATGNMKHSNDLARSLSFEQVVKFLPQNANLFCLQKEFRPDNAKFLDRNKHIHYFGKQLGDFADTAALIACMDLVITVDTSVAHLAASMGKPTWIMLPFAPDFRWLLDRNDSPWYPSVKLYRQTKLGDWDEVLQRIEADLTHFLA
ncbi:MAG: hypothetical protein CTY10_09690 [Methylotenera sp.]|nr:MAG: hypothetical protein CTY10_09690 [Methylotenera sp.]